MEHADRNAKEPLQQNSTERPLIVGDKQISYVLVVPDSPRERLAFPPEEPPYVYTANFLNSVLRQTTGVELPLVNEADAGAFTHRIFIGPTGFARQHVGNLTKLKPEELVIKPVGDDLILCGEVNRQGVDRGVLFAVYEFAERFLGVRWFFPENSGRWPSAGSGVIMPQVLSLALPTTEVRDHPKFQRREGGVSYYSVGMEHQIAWHPALRFGSTALHQNANHTQIEWFDLYSATHPEYFAKDKSGKPRLNAQYKHRNYICLSSKAVLKQMLDNIRRHDRCKRRGAKPSDQCKQLETAWGNRPPESKCVYFACNDGMTLQSTCHCPACRRLLSSEKTQDKTATGSNLVFHFAIKYARAVRRRWPRRRFATLAYSHYLAPPDAVIPRKQAKRPGRPARWPGRTRRLPRHFDLTYVCADMHYSNNPDIRQRHRDYLKRWSKLLHHNPDRLGIWLNIVYPAYNQVSTVPFMYPYLFQEWLNETRDMVHGYFINGLNPYLNKLGEDGVRNAVQTFPMAWLQSRLLWNPDADVKALLEEYCTHLYGPAWAEMMELYNLIIERWEGCSQSVPDMAERDFIHNERYPPGQMSKFEDILERAENKSLPDPRAYKLITYLKHCVFSRFIRESRDYHGKQK